MASIEGFNISGGAAVMEGSTVEGLPLPNAKRGLIGRAGSLVCACLKLVEDRCAGVKLPEDKFTYILLSLFLSPKDFLPLNPVFF